MQLAKIIGCFIQASLAVHLCKVQEEARLSKIDGILDFATKIMTCQYYRDVVRHLKSYLPPLLGYESACVFFKDPQCKYNFSNSYIAEDTLFTVSVQEKDPTISASLALAKELTFPVEQIVVFTADMGISGEVFRKVHYKFENGLDKLVGSGSAAADDDEGSTDHSLLSRLKSLPVARAGREHSFQLKRSNTKQRKQVELEEILEDNPHAENELQLPLLPSESPDLRMNSLDSSQLKDKNPPSVP